jgi:hypothetical protein
VAKSRLSILIIGWRSVGRGSFPGLVLFRLVAPPLQPEVVGMFPGMGCMVLCLPLDGTDRIQNFRS